MNLPKIILSVMFFASALTFADIDLESVPELYAEYCRIEQGAHITGAASTACGYITNEFALNCVRLVDSSSAQVIKYCGVYIDNLKAFECVERAQNLDLSAIRNCSR